MSPEFMNRIRPEYREVFSGCTSAVEVADEIVANVDHDSWRRALADVWFTVAEVVADPALQVTVFRQVLDDLMTDQEREPGVRRGR